MPSVAVVDWHNNTSHWCTHIPIHMYVCMYINTFCETHNNDVVVVVVDINLALLQLPAISLECRVILLKLNLNLR